MKSVGSYEAKTHLPRLLGEVEKGETITITKRGKVVAEVKPKVDTPRKSVIGMLRSPDYRSDWDHEAPTSDPDDWEALR